MGWIRIPEPVDGGVAGVRIGAEVKYVIARYHSLDLQSAVDENQMAFAKSGVSFAGEQRQEEDNGDGEMNTAWWTRTR